jgi:hypothetical protein
LSGVSEHSLSRLAPFGISSPAKEQRPIAVRSAQALQRQCA